MIDKSFTYLVYAGSNKTHTKYTLSVATNSKTPRNLAHSV